MSDSHNDLVGIRYVNDQKLVLLEKCKINIAGKNRLILQIIAYIELKIMQKSPVTKKVLL